MHMRIHVSTTFLILLITTIIGPLQALDSNYEQQRLVNCLLRSTDEVHILHGLRARGLIDLWTEGVDSFPANVTFRCQANVTRAISLLLNCNQQRLLLPVIERAALADNIRTKSFNSSKQGEEFFDNYRSYQDIQQWLLKLSSRLELPVLVRLDSIGKSVEGRDIPVVHITRPQGSLFSKKIIWVSGGQHAREWIAPSSILYLIDSLVEQRDPILNDLLSNYILVIAPLLNPDGYEYSRSNDRLWRKNRSRNADGSFGTDLNRNWGAQWGSIGASKDPNSDIFCGIHAMSEPETALTAKYIQSLPAANRLAGLDVHSYGQKVMRNFGYTTQDAKDERKIKPIGDAMASKASKIHQTKYQSLKSASLYPTGGGMDDWFYLLGGMHGFTIELRDDGRSGFLLPAKYIRLTGDELVEIVKQLLLGLNEQRRSRTF